MINYLPFIRFAKISSLKVSIRTFKPVLALTFLYERNVIVKEQCVVN